MTGNVKSQKSIIETYLRGKKRSLSSKEAEEKFGIKNLRARISEMRKDGLVVVTSPNAQNTNLYAIKQRDVNGNRKMLYTSLKKST